MLQKLFIKNYALIKELNIAPNSKLNTITGETGAGKSIMLGAVGLLLGKRADTKVLFQEDEKCIVEGNFIIKNYSLRSFFESEDLDYDEECIIRREISSTGKSRAFINDTPVTLDILKELGSHLMDVHSQHQTLLLGEQDFQLQLIDAYTNSFELVSEYQSSFRVYRQSKKELEDFRNNHQQMQADKDYNQFLFDELDKAELRIGEQEELEGQLKTLENGEFIKQKLSEASTLLEQSEYDVNSALHQVVEAFRRIQSYHTNYQELFDRLNSTFIEIQDITSAIEVENSQFEHDPLALQQAQDRLSLIYQLQKKHQVDSIEELIEIKDSIERRLVHVEDAGEHIAKLESDLSAAEEKMLSLGEKLSDRRESGLIPIEKELKGLLADLGMEDAQVKCKREEKKPELNGLDSLNILFSANKGIAPQQLKSVASGGEFSRLMFAFKYVMADKVSMPTIIFDEIDTGISGEIAIKMVNMMQRMADNHQVITISHLPQIAAKGDHHYFVFKDNSSEKSVSKIKLLKQEERIVEIAKMIGGDQPSDSAIKSAEELLLQ